MNPIAAEYSKKVDGTEYNHIVSGYGLTGSVHSASSVQGTNYEAYRAHIDSNAGACSLHSQFQVL